MDHGNPLQRATRPSLSSGEEGAFEALHAALQRQEGGVGLD